MAKLEYARRVMDFQLYSNPKAKIKIFLQVNNHYKYIPSDNNYYNKELLTMI